MSATNRQIVVLATVLGAGRGNVWAGVEAWRVNEVSASSGGNGTLRFVELYAPPSALADNCFYATTRLEVLAEDGTMIGNVTPFAATTCFAGDTYFLLATVEAAAAYDVTRDGALPHALAGQGGQVCLRSSGTRYDCARWGDVSVAITDFGNPSDTSVAPAIPDGQALARVATTQVVVTDFAVQAPTPRASNDGSPWFPPDAGPSPDATVVPDALVADARVFIDARPRPDAEPHAEPPAWTAAAPGGAGCNMATSSATRSATRSGGARPMALFLAVGLAVIVVRPSRRNWRTERTERTGH